MNRPERSPDDTQVAREEVKPVHNWKPISLRLPFLQFMLLATISTIIILQSLLYKSQTQGGILFAPSIDELPLSVTFGYRYAPTIIAVIYGFLWSWIDHDTKRMEPYFQLCSPGGASAEEILLLQYPLDFIAFVPFRAARRKHWSVFSAASASIIVSWTLVPLQAAIFATENQTHAQVLVLLPGFTYAVEALLVLIALCNMSVIHFSVTRKCKFQSDPSAIISHMSATSEDAELLALFDDLINRPSEDLHTALMGSVCSMNNDGKLELQSAPTLNHSSGQKAKQTLQSDKGHPPELQWYSGVLFLAIQLACIAVLGFLFHQARAGSGLPLPSISRFMRQILQNCIPVTLSACLEPVWVLLTRHLCELQTSTELRRGKVTSMKSVNPAYMSLPPQLAIFEALRAGHFMLSLLAFVATLASVLTVISSRLFFEHTVRLDIETMLQPLLSLPFRDLNETAPNSKSSKQSGSTQDEFHIALYNAMGLSGLPSWTDPDRFYFPITFTENTQANVNYTVKTDYFGVSLGCHEFSNHTMRDFEDETGNPARQLEFKIAQLDGSIAVCSIPLPTGAPKNVSGSSSLELAAAAEGSDFCRQNVVAGWWRGYASDQEVEVTNKTMMLCNPMLVTGSAQVNISSTGRVQRPKVLSSINGSLPEYFTTHPSDLILQAHRSIIDKSGIWHNDNSSSDWLNRLMAETFVDNRFLDPNLPPPTFSQAVTIFCAMYNKLFAIFLAHNKDLLFTPSGPTNPLLPVVQHSFETRIFLSTPAFIVAQTILCIYAFTTMFLYIRRPWWNMQHPPTLIAATFALFAASRAVRETEHTFGEES
ncbi:hypothetical protein D6D12_01354 [Aureobasidium pullulans]|uniref:Transmembrane protein n=1 Tax=Aureobasidium pullulans TaxID=5580 RepID=A0AB74K3T8_AURPU|nr:hypothetical protein D6D12_01354 [Aureobasidium pullulans]THX35988.1 hypothetical protein D6D11_09504 [Aureobasidium pullulans]